VIGFESISQKRNNGGEAENKGFKDFSIKKD
jgi:hypothetical protein